MNERGDQEPHSFDEWMRDFVREPTLWPVLIAVAGTFSTMGAALLVLALGDRNLFAMAALAIVVVGAGRGGVRAWRSGRRGVPMAMLALGSLSSLGAWAAMRWMP